MGDFMDSVMQKIINPIVRFIEIILDLIFIHPVVTVTVGLLLINGLGLLLMRIDKKTALKNGKAKEEHPDLDEKELRRQGLTRRRIPERTLLLTAAVFGSLGILGGMYKYKHKTQKPLFKYGVPTIIAIQVALIIYNIIRALTKA